MANPLNLAPGTEESYVVRYAQDLSDFYDITWVAEAYAVLAKDIYGRPIDFNQDGRNDSYFVGGVTQQLLNYTSSPGDGTLVTASRNGQGAIALGGSGGQALEVVADIGLAGSNFTAFPNFKTVVVADKAAVFDANNDGYQDIFAFGEASTGPSTTGPQARVYLYSPTSQKFDVRQAVSLPPTALTGGFGEVTFNDFNKDGIVDMVWTNYVAGGGVSPKSIPSSYTLYFGEANNSGAWNYGFHTAGSLAPITFDVADITRGNIFDGADTYKGTPDITPVAHDFDGDGDIDLAMGTGTGITAFTNPGNGLFNPSSGTNIQGRAEGLFLKTGDFNNDGLLDIISSPNSNAPESYISQINASITLYLNTSTPGQVNFRPYSVGGLKDIGLVNGPIATGDMDLDGNIDLILAACGSDNSRFYVSLGDGQGNFGNPTAWLAYSNLADPLKSVNVDNSYRTILDIDTGDFDGDGQLDVVSLAGSTEFRKDQLFGINSVYGVALNRTNPPISNGGPSGSPGSPAGGNGGSSASPGSPADGIGGDAGSPESGASTEGTSQLVATHRVDILTGTSESDRFVFPDIKSGTNRNKKHKKHQADQIINYQSDDKIEFDGFDVRVIGLGPSSKQIFDTYGTVRNTRTRTVHKLIGKAFKPREAALFQVHGLPGSFLAVNNKRSGFDRHDTLIHLVDFVPSTEAPLTLA